MEAGQRRSLDSWLIGTMWVAILWTDCLSLTHSVAIEGSKQVQKSPSLVTAAPILLLPRPSGFICNMMLEKDTFDMKIMYRWMRACIRRQAGRDGDWCEG